MAKYRIYIEWEGSNEITEDCDSEEEAIEVGYGFADGCASCTVSAELIEDDEDDDYQDEN